VREPLSREAQLLLVIARPSLDEASRERIRSLIQSGLDWNLLHIIASRHRLGMFLYTHLNAVAAPEVPRPVFMDLWRTYENNSRLNASRLIEVARIVKVLEASGIPVVPYKGVVTALQIYGDLSLREFEDLDILVRFDDMNRAKAILGESGYHTADALDSTAEAAMYQSREQYHRVFVHRQTGEKLEVHWKTDPRFPVERSNEPAWWDGLPRIDLGGTPARTFTWAEQVIILSLHGTKHQGHRLGWMLELATLINRQDVDWRFVEQEITRLGCRRRVLVSLLLARQWAGAVLPDAIDRAIAAEAQVTETARAIGERLFTTDVNEREAFDRLRLDLQLYDRWPQRVKHLADVTLTPTTAERQAYSLPRSLEFLYWPVRVAKLAIKYAPRLRR